MKRSTIGIIGGAGPMAGILLTKKIISICQKKYGCVNDSDFPKIILLSFPFSEMLKPNTPLQQEGCVAEELKESIDFLIEAGVDYLAIACNTLHNFLCEEHKQLIDMTREVKDELEKKCLSQVFVLCTETSAQNKLYDTRSTIFPEKEEQKLVDETIDKILQGNTSHHDIRAFFDYLSDKINRCPEIDGVLLGCSELSVLHEHYDIPLYNRMIIDPLDIVSKKICETMNINGSK